MKNQFAIAGTILALLLPLLPTPSQASTQYDGCYQLYLPKVMYPAICLSGTLEEGIGGAGTRLGIFHTNTANLVGCLKSTALGMTPTSLTFEINGQRELILENVQEYRQGLKEGDAIIGRSRLKFVEVGAKDTARLQKIMAESSLCR